MTVIMVGETCLSGFGGETWGKENNCKT